MGSCSGLDLVVACGHTAISEDECAALGCCFVDVDGLDPFDNPPCFFSDAGEVYGFVTPPGPGLIDDEEGFAFAVVGDLGQTHNSETTLDHILRGDISMVITPGDLSYANCIQPRWDNYGLLVEPLSATKTWMVGAGPGHVRAPYSTSYLPLIDSRASELRSCLNMLLPSCFRPLAPQTVTGNHEPENPDYCGHSLKERFAAYNYRWGRYLPWSASGSPSMEFYSFETAGVHWVMLGSYSDFHPGSPQLEWLASDLATVDKSVTPWLVGVVHSPWYNSNSAHYNETEEFYFRVNAEPMLKAAGMDLMFAGHVHAYERSFNVYDNQLDDCGATFINIGDGGNHEGLATKWKDPQPEWSAFRESSYGHGELIVNRTHLTWAWHRNQDGEPTITDEITISPRPASC